MRKGLLSLAAWNTNAVKDYSVSSIDAYLNGEFLTRFDAEIYDGITAVPIIYTQNA